ncbi:MAG: threonine/serine dehydratase [Kiloniellales bacterium]|nr:threonine/serine dehydratase [Kiloniellales bacterium]
MDSFNLPGLAEIEAAARRIAGKAVVTPLLESPALNARLGGRILLKPETLQRTGSFKFRGAYNKLSQLDETQRKAGVVAYSSGNHAQGVAAAAQLLGAPATIVMPSDAPGIKVANTKGYGAEVVPYARASEDRKAIAEAIATERGATLVPPYDDPDIIAGQGTCGLEICQQAEALGASLDAILVCCGGGGLTAGVGTAARALSPETEVYTVEPAGWDDTARSLAAGRRLANQDPPASLCDALLAMQPGALTFDVIRRVAAGGFAVTEDEVAEAVRYAFQTLKLVVEPGGAVTLAALLTGRYDVRDRCVAVTLSGGNIDPALMARLLAER